MVILRMFFCFSMMLLVGRAHAVEVAAVPEAEGDGPQATDYMERYCLRFKQVSQEVIGTVIKDMESTPYPVDGYFQLARCQPDGYSDVIKSPLLHLVADDPNAREKFLNNVFAYYSKKRKQPEIFTSALNAKNTKGETLLDYIETLKARGMNKHPEQMAVILKIVAYACEHGGYYAAYKDMKCQVGN